MRSSTRKVRDLTVFAMFGGLMFASRVAMAGIPGVHLLGLFIAALTLTYRTKALIPLYVFILLEGIHGSFGLFWLAYLYIWIPLWGMFMLAGKPKLPRKAQVPLFMLLCGLHGLSFGALGAPVGALMFGVKTWAGVIAWIINGLPFDITMAISNFFMGMLIIPLSDLLKKLNNQQ